MATNRKVGKRIITKTNLFFSFLTPCFSLPRLSPRTTVKRIIDQYLEKEVFKKTPKGLITIGVNYRSNNKNRRIASYHFFQQVAKKTIAQNLKLIEE